MIKEFLKKAKEDQPVYITHVREAFSLIDNDLSDEVILVDRLISNEEDKVFTLKVPAVRNLSEEETAFAETYINAEIYNILSSLGGKYITFYLDTSNEKLYNLFKKLDATFDINEMRKNRQGFGKCLNVIDRMIAGIAEDSEYRDKGFHFIIKDKSDMPEKFNELELTSEDNDIFNKVYKNIDNKILCGIDIGGTDIKAVLVVNGELKYIKEHDWFPALYRTADKIIDPIVDIVRLLRIKASYDKLSKEDISTTELSEIGEDIEKAFDKEISEDFIHKTVSKAESLIAENLLEVDGVGMCFPDVVVKDRIVGGETYKTIGIRSNPDVDYELEFAKFLGLNEKLLKIAKSVKNTNDGPMASFTGAVEWAASDKGIDLKKGIFAHTLGTELGTGWVDGKGNIPEIPLEVYNFIIDLGSFTQKDYESNDVRSINNFNTNLAGTLQKYASQSGAFRLAIKYFTEKRPDLIKEIEDLGFIKYKESESGKGIYIEVEQKDMRKPFLEFLMSLPDREYDPNVSDEENAARKIWMDIGEYMAVTWCETERILKPAVKSRILFGRLIKNKTCFELMKKGAAKIKPGLLLEPADETMAYSPLMKQLEETQGFTVAQFAQAIGAVYYGNTVIC